MEFICDIIKAVANNDHFFNTVTICVVAYLLTVTRTSYDKIQNTTLKDAIIAFIPISMFIVTMSGLITLIIYVIKGTSS